MRFERRSLSYPELRAAVRPASALPSAMELGLQPSSAQGVQLNPKGAAFRSCFKIPPAGGVKIVQNSLDFLLHYLQKKCIIILSPTDRFR